MLNICSYFILIIFCISCTKKSKDNFEDSIVSVNKASLSGFEFSKILVRKFVEQDVKYPKPEIINVLKKQIIEDFILQTVFEEYANEKNILVKKDILDSAFKEFKEGFPDVDSFEVFLNESGQTRAAFRKNLKKGIIRDLVTKDLFKDKEFKIEKIEISTFYKENRDLFKREDQIYLKQIYFESDEDGNRIKALLDKTGSKNFENIAKKYSLGPEKKDGGDLGWVNTNSYSAFKEAAKTPKGRITDIIKSENGSHIFKIVDIRKETILSLSDSEEQIKKIILKNKKNNFINTWVKERIASSKVKINEDFVNKILVNRPTNL